LGANLVSISADNCINIVGQGSTTGFIGYMSESKIAEVGQLLAELSKTVKVVSMYPEDNPLPVKLKESFNERFIDFITENGTLCLQVACGELFYEGQSVFKDPEEEDSLGALFHNSGITRLCFTPDFDYPESNQFFQVIKRFLNREEGATDLVSLLWQTNIPGLDYHTLEDMLLQEYTGDFQIQEKEHDGNFIRNSDPETDDGEVQFSSIFLDDDNAGSGDEWESSDVEYDGDAGGAISTVAPSEMTTISRGSMAERQMGMHPAPKRKKTALAETTMILNDAFSLEEDDWSKVKGILEEDARFDMYDSAVSLLREMIRHETEYAEFDDTITTVERVHSGLLSAGQMYHAAQLIVELKELEQHLIKSQPRWADRVHTALIIAGGREVFNLLTTALNRDPKASVEDFTAYLECFGWEALGAEFNLLGDLEHAEHRLALCDFLVCAGASYVDIIAKGIYDKRWYIVRNTVYILARIGNKKALSYLEKAQHHEEARVRLEVARGLLDAGEAGKSELVAEFVWDADETVSKTVIDSIIAGNADNTIDTITAVINDDRFGILSELDQESFLITFSKLAGDRAVGYLTRLISEWRLFPNAAQLFYQQAAFQALANNRSHKAEATLLKYSRSLRKRIRRLASQALARRRAIIYGD